MTRMSFPLYSGDLASTRSECSWLARGNGPHRRRIAMENEDTVGGYAVPVDPMDLLQCDSCQ
jgi:hypothetical protein